MLKTISALALLLGLVLLAGCGKSSQATVSGTVTYLQRIALPPDAVVTVRIEDVSKADAMAEVIGEQVIHTDGAQVPIPFEVAYDTNQIEENHSYSLRARIEDGAGKLLFTNDTSVPVITRGNPTQDVKVLVVPVGG
jgi:putative lipoprotein